jgi:hypothetical protein
MRAITLFTCGNLVEPFDVGGCRHVQIVREVCQRGRRSIGADLLDANESTWAFVAVDSVDCVKN